MTTHSDKTITTLDGTKIYMQTWSPAQSSPKAQVLFVHGYLEHSGIYAELAEFWAEQGIVTHAFDYRGHGKSSGQRGYVWSFSQYHDDLETALKTLDTTSIPTFLLGHSNGALIVLDYYLENQQKLSSALKGMLISSPFLAPAAQLPAYKKIASKVLGCIVPRLSMPANEVTSKVLTHDVEKQQAHDADPLILYNFTVGWAKEGMNVQARVLNECRTVNVPLFYVFAGQDQVADPNVNREFGQQISQEDKTIVERPDDFHEVLNEINRRELFEQMSQWILERAK